MVKFFLFQSFKTLVYSTIFFLSELHLDISKTKKRKLSKRCYWEFTVYNCSCSASVFSFVYFFILAVIIFLRKRKTTTPIHGSTSRGGTNIGSRPPPPPSPPPVSHSSPPSLSTPPSSSSLPSAPSLSSSPKPTPISFSASSSSSSSPLSSVRSSSSSSSSSSEASTHTHPCRTTPGPPPPRMFQRERWWGRLRRGQQEWGGWWGSSSLGKAGWGRGGGCSRMRWVWLCIMTGVGFCLGLLCSLLMQLPSAHNLPAQNFLNPSSSSSHTGPLQNQKLDPGFRSRRSFSAVEGPVHSTAGGGAQVSGEHRAALVVREREEKEDEYGSNSRSSVSEEGQSFQSVPGNPLSASNPFVSGRGPGDSSVDGVRREKDNGQLPTARSAAQAAIGAEGGARAVKGEPRAASGGDPGYVNTGDKKDHHRPSSSSSVSPTTTTTNLPVKSFTLRLKNTGDKFVVDSAVRRTVAVVGEEEEKRGGDEFVKTFTQKSLRNDDDNNATRYFAAHSNRTLGGVVSGVLWSRALDDSCPKGFHPRDVTSWRRKVSRTAVVRVEEGCGRMQNRRLTLTDGSRVCARYRFNTDQIQGEAYSYYLARLLNITNLPPSILLPVDTLSPQWRSVHLDLSSAQWADGRLVVLSRWLDDLAPAYIPEELRSDEDRRLHPSWETLGGKTSRQLCDLLQWSDLIVFDYLTANLDRMVNNMFNQQWNAEMMSNPAHNLERTSGGSLVFLDNESGLFHGYRLLEKYHAYHESLLSSLCVFRGSTVRAVKELHREGWVGKRLQEAFAAGEAHHKLLPAVPEKNLAVLKERLGRVYGQIVKCEDVYPQPR